MIDPQQAIEEMIISLTDGKLFSELEARSILRSVTAERPEDLVNNVLNVILWCRKVRTTQAILDVILKLGEHGAVDVRPTTDGDIEMRLNISPEQIEMIDD